MRYLLLPLVAITVTAQTPEFEVASLRPSGPMLSSSGPSKICTGPKTGAENVQMYTSLSIMVAEAYTNQADRLDLPNPANSPNFSLSVRIPADTSVETCRQMFRKLLAERIHLITDVNPGEITTYVLRVARPGLKMKPVPGPPPDVIASYKSGGAGDHLVLTFQAAPVERIRHAVEGIVGILAILNRSLARGDVRDETGLTGYYDRKLEFDMPAGRGNFEVSYESTLREALVSQLGLTIELRKTIGKVLAVRSADSTPTEN